MKTINDRAPLRDENGCLSSDDERVARIRRYYACAKGIELHPEILEAYIHGSGLPLETATSHMVETKKFICIRAAIDGPATDGDFQIGMSGPVDDFWHMFLLYSPEYFAFCDKVCGFYVQHRPNPRTMSKREEVDRLLNLFHWYEAAFGQVPPERIWTLTRANILARLEGI